MLVDRVMPLLGKSAAEPGLEHLLRELGDWPLRESALFLAYERDGYALVFEPGRMGAKTAARLTTVFFYPHFAGPLPRGITWRDTSRSLFGRFGEPSFTYRTNTTGALRGYRWDDARVSLNVNIAEDGVLTRVSLNASDGAM